jgi:MFS superfamily sulfate permease-like transporter
VQAIRDEEGIDEAECPCPMRCQSLITCCSLIAYLAVTTGLDYLLLGLQMMGWSSRFISEEVLVGFIFGFGIEWIAG